MRACRMQVSFMSIMFLAMGTTPQLSEVIMSKPVFFKQRDNLFFAPCALPDAGRDQTCTHDCRPACPLPASDRTPCTCPPRARGTLQQGAARQRQQPSLALSLIRDGQDVHASSTGHTCRHCVANRLIPWPFVSTTFHRRVTH